MPTKSEQVERTFGAAFAGDGFLQVPHSYHRVMAHLGASATRAKVVAAVLSLPREGTRVAAAGSIVADRTGTSRNHASEELKRLVDDRWLVLVRRGRSGVSASVYDVAPLLAKLAEARAAVGAPTRATTQGEPSIKPDPDEPAQSAQPAQAAQATDKAVSSAWYRAAGDGFERQQAEELVASGIRSPTWGELRQLNIAAALSIEPDHSKWDHQLPPKVKERVQEQFRWSAPAKAGAVKPSQIVNQPLFADDHRGMAVNKLKDEIKATPALLQHLYDVVQSYAPRHTSRNKVDPLKFVDEWWKGSHGLDKTGRYTRNPGRKPPQWIEWRAAGFPEPERVYPPEWCRPPEATRQLTPGEKPPWILSKHADPDDRELAQRYYPDDSAKRAWWIIDEDLSKLKGVRPPRIVDEDQVRTSAVQSPRVNAGSKTIPVPTPEEQAKCDAAWAARAQWDAEQERKAAAERERKEALEQRRVREAEERAGRELEEQCRNEHHHQSQERTRRRERAQVVLYDARRTGDPAAIEAAEGEYRLAREAEMADEAKPESRAMAGEAEVQAPVEAEADADTACPSSL